MSDPVFCIDEQSHKCFLVSRKHICPMKSYPSPCNLTTADKTSSDYSIISVRSPVKFLMRGDRRDLMV